MGTLTIRLPDATHQRLKAMAKHRKVSVNKIIEELSTKALAEFDSEIRFRELATMGDPKRGLELLGKIDKFYHQNS